MKNFAIIDIDSKQYYAVPGETLETEKIDGKKGDKIAFDKVLLQVNDTKIDIGQPFLKKIIVNAKIIEHFKDKKIRVAKFKAKSRYRRVMGHRQQKTKIEIIDIREK